MTISLNPYISFRDTAREAITFWHRVLGGELSVSTFGEMHASDDPAEQDKVMHASIVTPDGLTLMASDTPNSMAFDADASRMSVSLSGDDGEALRRYWNGLSVGATIIEPLTMAPWGDAFGMLTDRFGITWLVNITGGDGAS